MLTLYDPDRSQSIVQLGEIRPWSAFIAAMRGGAVGAGGDQGRRPAHPHRDGELADAGRADPAGAGAASRREVDSVGADAARQRARRRPRSRSASTVEPRLRLHQGRRRRSRSTPTSSSSEGAANLRYSRQFASRRRLERNADDLNRLYVVEADAVGDRRQRRSPRAAQGEPDRSLRARDRRAAWACAGVAGAAPAGTRSRTSTPSPRIWWRIAARRSWSPARRSRRPCTRSRTR